MIRRRSSDPRVIALRGLPLFAGCSDKELQRLAPLLTELVIPAGGRLVAEGTTGRECMILLEGVAEVHRGGRRLGELGPGSVVGEMALLQQIPRTATVVALTRVRVYLMNPVEFQELLDRSPRARAAVEQAAEARAKQNRMLDARITGGDR